MKHKLCALSLAVAILSLLVTNSGAFADTAPAAASEDVAAEATYYELLGEERYTLIHEVRLTNSGLDTAYDVDVSIALMDKNTPLYTERQREQLLPWPDSITTDEFGRRVAYYHFDELASGTELVFTQKYVLECGGIKYPGLSTASQAGYEGQLAAQYLLPSRGIESDDQEIIDFALAQAGKGRTTYNKAHDAFAAVNQYMTYSAEGLPDNPDNRTALQALRRGYGVCEDYSKLYVAMLRSLGIAARQQSGYLYLPEQQAEPGAVDKAGRLNLTPMRHAWAEFYLPGQGWVIADPTFTNIYEINGVPVKFIKWDYFAGIPAERRYIFFREESLNEMDMVYLNVRRGGYVQLSQISGYLLPGSQAAYYNDLEGHWAEQAIMNLSDRDQPLLQGMGNGMFGVNEPMTRAQLVTCLQRVMKSPPAGCRFSDVPATHWAYRDIGAAQQAGWISGYPDGTFRPERPVTRAELAQLLVTVFALEMPQPQDIAIEAIHPEFTAEPHDVPATELTETAAAEAAPTESGPPPPAFFDLGQAGYAWADEAITILAARGLSQGNGQGYYQPERPVTRAEFATFLDRILTALGQ